MEEDFFKKLNLTVELEEFQIYDKYHFTIAISPKEAEIINQNTHRTRIVYIPMTQEPYYISNSYTGPALFPTGPNPFNVHGYLYFIKKVLPRVIKKAPSFSLQVTGAICRDVLPVEGISLCGFVPDLKSLYKSAKFVVCPVWGGTGQQVKIVEAMAHGVPVIASKHAAEASPIQHNVNGLIANDAEEFADYVVQLWYDKETCYRLGHAARETIASDFSRARLVEKLSSIITTS
ncbi:hypothetical protein DRO56_03500 [Candidatus Bathyarchaeota archaeon]|nr:MAG: hypothetical protein DRO56_03500 [Candidatus Bathyarchaeota archaeon]